MTHTLRHSYLALRSATVAIYGASNRNKTKVQYFKNVRTDSDYSNLYSPY